ncbi:MAG: 23S rRNA (uracil(1939)-C(5))-methyltransferase RlmD, partial [Candidatus Binatia bacterium]
FHAGSAEEVLPALGDRIERAAIVTLNPPRKGASAGVLDAITKLGPRRVVYVSCDPATLARDLDRLAGNGYRAMQVRPFDMLPQTEHVEVVAVCDRAGSVRG